jgi:hypothetical protein
MTLSRDDAVARGRYGGITAPMTSSVPLSPRATGIRD